MKTSEIRALLADCEDEYHLLGRNTGLNIPKLRTAIETMLAREAEVLRINDDMQLFARVKRNQIANILNPEGE